MIPTPDISHLKKSDYEHVYEPAEDTFLLLDALEQDMEQLREIQPLVCLEIGSGSGCVSAFITKILGPSSTLFLCTDINRFAADATRATGKQNKVPLEPVLASLASPLSSRLRRAVDILLFNPPYVPTIPDEADDAQTGAGIQGSWAGGNGGMQITDTFLQTVERLLSTKGRFYLVAVKDNDIPGIRARMLGDYGLKSEITLHRRAGREHLFVLMFHR
ncbi:S-adenosyl-L-methionine-dependent methyltransferase [Athelia psychrophila]|uniref:S-adenosyl-L-methionine-dependent methyltransferase n=1 Tax=Athelia psychrophila TaxID=1759441 RepID=A0A166V237_9AGAM|nr:S-adenosyl-L-methionine-dependent methyltransferase [Fibularhizoctonia sp. CBS 109695]